MTGTQNPTMFDEFTRGVKTLVRLSALLVMAGCQSQKPEPQKSVLDALFQDHPVERIAHIFQG